LVKKLRMRRASGTWMKDTMVVAVW
jgi:hypothetical protein